MATVAAAFAMNPLFFYVTRFFTGAGFVHGREDGAEQIVRDIEGQVGGSLGSRSRLLTARTTTCGSGSARPSGSSPSRSVIASSAPWYLIPLARGNFLGPLLFGHFFDSIGRRVMISMTYIVSGLSLILTSVLFSNGVLTATTLTAAWCVVFFFASAGASSAYLTVSEIFPMETRGMAIAFFYAVGTGLGGIIGPVLFGRYIEQGREQVAFG